ncbi:MAG: lysophospholipid acyltransferase family protein [Planctomycetota bacterium]
MSEIIPAKYSPRFDRFFAGYCGWLISRSYFSVRAVRGSSEALRAIEHTRRPTLVVFNHPSWWDPLVAKWLAMRLTPSRPTLAPMDRDQLERFGFFRRIGVFGIDPSDPGSLEPMLAYARAELEADPSKAFWITAQGQFTDPRSPIRLRPGAAAFAARLDDPVIVCVALEYAFWQDRKPEIFIRVQECPPPERSSTTGWLRTMTGTMRTNGAALAEAVVARDESAFEPLLGGGAAKINPIYDAWLRLRGRTGAVPRAHHAEASARGESANPAP